MVVAYCGRDCQSSHRKEHKRLCRKICLLWQQQKELQDSDDYSSNDLYETSTAFKISYYKNGIQLANSMLAMAFEQTSFDPRSYEIVLQQYVHLLEAANACFNAQLGIYDKQMDEAMNGERQEVDVEIINPHATTVTIILLLVALNRNDNVMTLLKMRNDQSQLWAEGTDAFGGHGERLSAFEWSRAIMGSTLWTMRAWRL